MICGVSGEPDPPAVARRTLPALSRDMPSDVRAIPSPLPGSAGIPMRPSGRDATDPVRIRSLKLGLLLVFLLFSMLHQIQTYLMGVNLYLLYLVGIPAIVGVVVAGGIGRTLHGRPALYLLGFVAFMALAGSIGSARGGSPVSFCFSSVIAVL